jgi:hypothetical protein
MRSSDRRRSLGLAVVAALTAFAARAEAQQVEGFAVERFYPSAPGAGWFVMDDLDMHGGLGGALAFTTGYARNPLRLEDEMQHLGVVSSQAFANFGLAVTYDRWRVYLDLYMPLAIEGQSGMIGGAQYAGPHLTLSSNPDTLADPRLGVEARLLGEAGGRFRLGASAELIAPNGDRVDYDTDGTFRAMIRALVAGDLNKLSYAGQLGVHIRPLDEAPAAGAPQGSELLFGAAGGVRVAARDGGKMSVVVGPEIYGATAFRSLFGSTTTALEGLLTGRLEGTSDQGRLLRVKLGAGAGINQDLGAPEWRVVLAIEVLGRAGEAGVGKF